MADGAGPAEASTLDPPKLLRATVPAPNTRSIAIQRGYSVEGLDRGAGGGPRPGDKVVALISLFSLDGRLPVTQWIVQLRLAALNGAGPAPNTGHDTTSYTNVGDAFVFHSAVTAMEMDTLGPVLAASRPDRVAVKHNGVAVSTDFLMLDLDRSADVVGRIQRLERRDDGAYDLVAGPHPFPAGEWETNRRRLADFGLTPDDRRSFAGAPLALFQFLDIIRNTPDLQGILFEVLEKPSIMDVVRHGGRDELNISVIAAGPSGARDIFFADPRGEFNFMALNLVIFGKAVLTAGLYLTQPKPPLEVTAGILGIVAFAPTKPDKVVVVRILSATSGGDGAAPGRPP